MLNKKRGKWEILVLIQILLLVNFSIATSYIIGKYYPDNEFTENTEKLFSFQSIGIVSASDSGYLKCCPVTNDGAICQDVPYTDTETCDNPIPASCDKVADCKIGCCFDESEGLCATNSPKVECENNGGIWKDSKNCEIEECRKGCCVLGSNVRFTTERECEVAAESRGFEKDFRADITTEYECLALAETQKEGACVIETKNSESGEVGNTCRFTTEAECLKIGGRFYEGLLCSNPSLETGCERQSYIGCVEGKDEIYWFDSCGNRENIYSSDRDASWNEGKVLTKTESCNPDSDNVDSKTCGNCNSALSSICATSDKAKAGEKVKKDGDYVCKSLKCIDSDGNERLNGESWCEYDSYIGDGKDPAGSLHWRKYCHEGEIITENCGDYRTGLCQQQIIEENGKTFSTANCVTNEALRCIDYNSDKDKMEELCNKNSHCRIKNINIDKRFRFSLCVPAYPLGRDFSAASGSSGATCSIANMKCQVVYKKSWKGKWKCKQNCNCEKKIFAEQMNDLCISLGDCGSYINYIGKGTNNIKVTRSPYVSWKEYLKYSNPEKGQYVKPQNVEDVIDSMIGESVNEIDTGEEGVAKFIETLGQISGAGGLLTQGGISIYQKFTTSLEGWFFAETTLASFASAAISAAIGAYVGTLLAAELGITGEGATAMAIGGGLAGAVIGWYSVSAGSTWGGFMSALGSPVFWVGVSIMVWAGITGWGKIKVRDVEFKCMPWQPPVGGKNCEKCNEDPSKPCTKYRCESLGTSCRLLNEDSENPVCQSVPYEPNPPVISPLEVSDGYQFLNEDEENKRVEVRSTDSLHNGCIQSFTRVNITLQTDEYAQCKFDLVRDKTYEEMGYDTGDYFIEQTLFTKNHTLIFEIPSIDALEANLPAEITGDLREKYGNFNIYVRCMDYHGNFNIEPYTINICANSEPDMTAPRIRTFNPADGSYLKYGATEANFTVYLNKPAECKYDVVGNKSYEDMDNAMNCNTDFLDPSLFGWECNSTISNLVPGENKIYIKCKNKPWVVTQEDVKKYGERVSNSQDIVYTLYVSEETLNITSASPSGEVKGGVEPITVNLEIETEGGSDDGIATCYYEWAGDWIEFIETLSTTHKQSLSLYEGRFSIPVKCEDSAGNIAETSVEFTLKLDTDAPVAVRAYHDGSYLKLITDEKAKCYYDFNRCNFNEENATSMTVAYSTEHTAEWNPGAVYHIKCEDLYGNSGCTIIISASSV